MRTHLLDKLHNDLVHRSRLVGVLGHFGHSERQHLHRHTTWATSSGADCWASAQHSTARAGCALVNLQAKHRCTGCLSSCKQACPPLQHASRICTGQAASTAQVQRLSVKLQQQACSPLQHASRAAAPPAARPVRAGAGSAACSSSLSCGMGLLELQSACSGAAHSQACSDASSAGPGVRHTSGSGATRCSRWDLRRYGKQYVHLRWCRPISTSTCGGADRSGTQPAAGCCSKLTARRLPAPSQRWAESKLWPDFTGGFSTQACGPCAAGSRTAFVTVRAHLAHKVPAAVQDVAPLLQGSSLSAAAHEQTVTTDLGTQQAQNLSRQQAQTRADSEHRPGHTAGTNPGTQRAQTRPAHRASLPPPRVGAVCSEDKEQRQDERGEAQHLHTQLPS